MRVERERVIREQRTIEVVYYITSLPRSKTNAQRLLTMIRRHWGVIENGLHYIRDVALGGPRGHPPLHDHQRPRSSESGSSQKHRPQLAPTTWLR